MKFVELVDFNSLILSLPSNVLNPFPFMNGLLIYVLVTSSRKIRQRPLSIGWQNSGDSRECSFQIWFCFNDFLTVVFVIYLVVNNNFTYWLLFRHLALIYLDLSIDISHQALHLKCTNSQLPRAMPQPIHLRYFRLFAVIYWSEIRCNDDPNVLCSIGSNEDFIYKNHLRPLLGW